MESDNSNLDSKNGKSLNSDNSSPKSDVSIDKLIGRQLATINIVIAGIGLMFIIAIFVLGYLQIKSANELSSTMNTIKNDYKENFNDYKNKLDNTLPRYDERIDRLTDDVNKKVDNNIADMTQKVNEAIGTALKPA
jgi:predicted PurR-regulated permease PerM